jgi:type II secretory ATPase GspE/PulE/Tfp pilus assembly ATPase PilB-like protein
MGVEPFLVTSTVAAAMAQRLVRTICSECKEQYTVNPDDLPDDFPYTPGMKLFRGAGCRKCRNTGYYGRAGLYELWTVEDRDREHIMSRHSSSVIQKDACEHGLKLLRKDGWDKVLSGMTTPEEVTRTTKV